MKKLIFILLAAASLLVASCGKVQPSELDYSNGPNIVTLVLTIQKSGNNFANASVEIKTQGMVINGTSDSKGLLRVKIANKTKAFSAEINVSAMESVGGNPSALKGSASISAVDISTNPSIARTITIK